MTTVAGRELEVRVVERLTGAHIVTCSEAQVDSVSHVLNDFGAMEFKQSTLSQGAADAMRLKEVEVQLWVDNTIYWWGIPMTEGGGPGEQDIGCDGLFCYFEDRMIDDRTLEWESIDQFNIARDLVLYAQSELYQPNRDFNIGTDIPSLSGKVRTQRYDRPEHQYISDLLREFPTLTDGFDWDIVYGANGLSRNWTPYYPRKGEAIDDLILEYGKNISNYGYSRSAVELRTQTYATGGSAPNTEEGRIEQVYEDVAASVKYGVVQATISDGTQMDPDWLLEKATKDVNQNKAPKGVPEITGVNLTDADLLLKVKTGDYVNVRIDDGARQVTEWFRVGEVKWNPPDDTISFKFIEEGLPA